MKKFITTVFATSFVALAWSQTYLPLTGGTLTGQLIGTSASFSGVTTLSGNVLVEGLTESGHVLKLGGVNKWQAYADAGSYRLYNYSLSSSALAIDNSTSALTLYGALSGTSATFSGDIGIGTTMPDSKLTVAGKIHSQEVKVSVNAGADFVFEKGYKLKRLEELEKYILENNHLPEVASADEMKKNGIELGEMNIKLLQKIEELTLHLIEQDKRLKEQEKWKEEQRERMKELQHEINQLKTKF